MVHFKSSENFLSEKQKKLT